MARYRSVLSVLLAVLPLVLASCGADSLPSAPDVSAPVEDVAPPPDVTPEPDIAPEPDVVPDQDVAFDPEVAPPEGCETDEECAAALAPLSNCEVARCDASTHICVREARPDDTPCDDGNLCTTGAVCAEGFCTGGVPVTCDDGNPCNGVETCDPATGDCVAGTPIVCDDGDPCNGLETCDPATGGCLPGTPVPCDDGVFCNGEETCDPATGRCVAGTPVSCDDGDRCTVGTCDEELLACVFEDKVCEDGNPCTVGSCDGATGLCTYRSVECSDPSNLCLIGTCDPDQGCVFSPRTCEDGNLCTTNGCDPTSGACVFTSVDCDDGDPCTANSCVRDTGGCITVPVDCDDGDLCTIGSCDGETGACVFVSVDCDDGDPCTLNACESATGGCSSAPKVCDDGDLCTTGACTPETGACVFSPVPCDDGDACTEDTCDPETGDCLAVHKECDDLDPCTTNLCDSRTGECLFPPVDCDDGDPCTVNSCYPLTGACVTAPKPCDDGDRCTTNGCDPLTGACVFLPVDCDDGDPCTSVGTCDPATGLCVLGEPLGCCDVDEDCDDGDLRTRGFCNDEGFCRFEFHDCALAGVLFEAAFDDGTLDGMVIIHDANPDDAVTWSVSHRHVYHARSLYLGDPACRWFFNGPRTVTEDGCETPYDELLDSYFGTGIVIDLATPAIDLPAGLPFALDFWIRGEGEWVDPASGLLPDNLRVLVEDTATGDRTLVFETADHNNRIPQPMFVAADISAFAGREIRVIFAFDSLGAAWNRFEGYYLDAIRVRSLCGDLVCSPGESCDDGAACTIDTCTSFSNGDGRYGVCAHVLRWPVCVSCGGTPDCDDGDTCTSEVCEGGICRYTFLDRPECCAEVTVLDEPFVPGVFPGVSGSAATWFITHDYSLARWQVAEHPVSGATALYFGDPDTWTYDNEGVAFGRALLGPFNLPDPAKLLIRQLVVRFRLLLSTEFDDEPRGIPAAPVDRLSVRVRTLDEEGRFEEQEIWNSTAYGLGGTTMGVWRNLELGLMPFAGQTVWLVWQFHSYDDIANDYGGAWIDDILVETVCESE